MNAIGKEHVKESSGRSATKVLYIKTCAKSELLTLDTFSSLVEIMLVTDLASKCNVSPLLEFKSGLI